MGKVVRVKGCGQKPPRWRWAPLFIVGGVFLSIMVACSSPSPPTASSAGIPVATEFAEYYDIYGGARLFGKPITMAFRASEDGPLLQYFQTMRLEYTLTDGIEVTRLGEWAYAGLVDPQPASLPENGRIRTFPDTGQTVQDEFLTFYESFNGDILLGNPISPQINEGGLRVQYFENGRLEWRPQLAVGQRVQVGLLGQAHFDAEMGSFYYSVILARPAIPGTITQVEVIASVQSPILYAGDSQVLYVTVRALDGQPVATVTVRAIVAYGDGVDVIALGQTDSAGQIGRTLDLNNIPPGQTVEMTIEAVDGNDAVIGTTVLNFKTWW